MSATTTTQIHLYVLVILLGTIVTIYMQNIRKLYDDSICQRACERNKEQMLQIYCIHNWLEQPNTMYTNGHSWTPAEAELIIFPHCHWQEKINNRSLSLICFNNCVEDQTEWCISKMKTNSIWL